MIEEADIVVITDSSIEGSIPKNLRKNMKNKFVVWSIADPSKEPIEVVRFIRDQIDLVCQKTKRHGQVREIVLLAARSVLKLQEGMLLRTFGNISASFVMSGVSDHYNGSDNPCET